MTIGQSPTRSPGSRSCRHMNATRVVPPAGLMAGWLTMFVVGTDLFVVSPLLPMIAAPADRRATWMALVVSGLLLSLALGAPIGAWAGASIGWKPVFAVLAGLSLCLVWPNFTIWPRDRTAAQNGGASFDILPAALV